MLVIGGGAIGGVLAARMSASPHDVVLVEDWPDHLESIRRNGLQVESSRGSASFRVHAISSAEIRRLDWLPDLALICLKSYDTERALDLLEPLLGQTTIVASAQNGINEVRIGERLGAPHVIGMVTELGGFVKGLVHVVETRPDGGLVIGELDGTMSERSNTVAGVLTFAAPTSVSRNITGLLWSKLLWNCVMNPLTALSGLGQGRFLHMPDAVALAREVAKEVASVASKLEVTLEPLDFLGIDPRLLASADQSADGAWRRVTELYSTQMDKSTSMAQDIVNGRRTEIDYLNGFVVSRGHAIGVATPLNKRLVSLIHDLEIGSLQPQPALLQDVSGRGLRS